MFEWKVENLKLKNTVHNKNITGDTKYKFPQEFNTSREDKIQFVDSMTKGNLSYLLNLISLWENEKQDLCTDWSGNVKTISLIAWCKRNDPRRLIDTKHRYGDYEILGCIRSIENSHRCYHYDTYADLVDETFHRQLLKCLEQEKEYFLKTDPYETAKSTIRTYHEKYHTTFDIPLVFCRDNIIKLQNGDNHIPDLEISPEQCIVMLELFRKLDTEIMKLSDIALDKFYFHRNEE